MNRALLLIHLMVFMTLTFSCIEKASIEQDVNENQILGTSITDTLKFSSGIRSIFQDSKGHYWFGSLDEGVWKYDERTMSNYTTKDGLINDFAQSIYNDKKGDLWFGMSDGNIFKYTGEVFEQQFKK